MQWSLTNAEVVCVEAKNKLFVECEGVCVSCTFHNTAGDEGGIVRSCACARIMVNDSPFDPVFYGTPQIIILIKQHSYSMF